MYNRARTCVSELIKPTRDIDLEFRVIQIHGHTGKNNNDVVKIWLIKTTGVEPITTQESHLIAIFSSIYF